MKSINKMPHAFVDLNRSLGGTGTGMDMSMIRSRMDELGIDLATLNRRYCEIRRKKGDTAATPVNRRNMLSKAISDQGNPTLETFIDLVAALDGKVLIEWKSTKLQEFGGDNVA